MIYVRTFSAVEAPDPLLQITISGTQDLQKLQALLNRSLNCAPEFGPDWFALSDRLEQFMTANNIPLVKQF